MSLKAKGAILAYYRAGMPQFSFTGSFSGFLLTWMPLALFVPSLSSSLSLVSKHCSEHSWAVASLSTACERLSKMFI